MTDFDDIAVNFRRAPDGGWRAVWDGDFRTPEDVPYWSEKLDTHPPKAEVVFYRGAPLMLPLHVSVLDDTDAYVKGRDLKAALDHIKYVGVPHGG